MVLGKLPVPGRPTNLDDSGARAYCACSRCGWGCLDILTLLYPFSPLSPSLWETARYRLKYCLKGQPNPKQPTKIHFYLSKEIRLDIKSFFSENDEKVFISVVCCSREWHFMG